MVDNPEWGRVFWSGRAQRFYQEGREGAIPNLEALEHLRFRMTDFGERLVDERGQFVPDLANLIPHNLVNEYVDRLRSGSLTSKDVYTERAKPDSYYASLVTWEDPEGRLHLVEKFGRVGGTLNNELLIRQLQAQIGSELGLDRADWYTEATEAMVRAMFWYELT